MRQELPICTSLLNNISILINVEYENCFSDFICSLNLLVISIMSCLCSFQDTLEDISYLLRIPQRKPYGTMEGNVKKALKVFNNFFIFYFYHCLFLALFRETKYWILGDVMMLHVWKFQLKVSKIFFHSNDRQIGHMFQISYMITHVSSTPVNLA